MQKNKNLKKRPVMPRKSLRGRLYIFPALLPLIEILPWFLTAVGAIASAIQAVRRRFRGSVDPEALIFAMSCFVLAAGLVFWQYMHRPSEEEGSCMVEQADLPRLELLGVGGSGQATENFSSFERLWFQAVQREPTTSSLVIADGLLLVGNIKGSMNAYDAATGEPVWVLHLREPMFANALVLKDRAFIAEGMHVSNASSLTAIDFPAGNPLWQRQFRNHTEAAPAVSKERHQLWLANGSEGLWALDSRDGSVLWRKKIGHLDLTPLFAGDVLYAPAQPDEAVMETSFFALDPDNGKELWQVKLPGHPMASPQLSSQQADILLTTATGQVGVRRAQDKGWAHAITQQGKILWSVELPGEPLPEEVILQSAGLVYHALKTGELVALHVNDGSMAWSAKIGEALNGAAGLSNDASRPLIAAVATDGRASVRNAIDGSEIIGFDVGSGGYTAPLFDGDILYIATPTSISAYGGVGALLKLGN